MVVVYNSVVYPVGVLLWLRRIFSFRGLFHRLCAASAIDSASLARARRRLIHLPWFAAAICGVAWFLCIPVFIGALLQVQNPLDPRLLWHLPISFCVSGFIAVTHSFFLVELASHCGLFPVFFRGERADLTPGVFTLSLRDPGLNGVQKEITVMFVDMRSWTARTSVSVPSDVVEVMNDFFRVTVRVVEEEHRGMVNKYLGDGFMAIFGAGDSGSNHADDAVAAGREILAAVKKLNEDLAAKGRAPIQIGIGIHCGPAIVGSIGSPQRLEFTAIGNTVNIASRLEGLTKSTGRPLLVTAAVRERAGNSFIF